MTDSTISSLKQFKASRDAYRQFLKEQISVNKTKADAVDLFEFNGSRPYYQPDIRSRTEKLNDKSFVRSDLVNFMVEEGYMDSREGPAMVGDLSDDYVQLLFKYLTPFFKIYKQYNRLYDGKEMAREFVKYIEGVMTYNTLKEQSGKQPEVEIVQPRSKPRSNPQGEDPVEVRRSKRKQSGTGVTLKISKGVKPTPDYHQFGKNIINKSKLDNNILMMRYKNGVNITKYPTRSVSQNLSNIIRNMLLEKNPSYDELDGLNQDEKQFLHELCSYCKVIDRFSIPTPNKSSEKKEADRFQLLIGQLKAGNNSREMIKELKQLLIKFRAKKKLPIQEINEILLTLIELGY